VFIFLVKRASRRKPACFFGRRVKMLSAARTTQLLAFEEEGLSVRIYGSSLEFRPSGLTEPPIFKKQNTKEIHKISTRSL
jgi:hypothetical protein